MITVNIITVPDDRKNGKMVEIEMEKPGIEFHQFITKKEALELGKLLMSAGKNRADFHGTMPIGEIRGEK